MAPRRLTKRTRYDAAGDDGGGGGSGAAAAAAAAGAALLVLTLLPPRGLQVYMMVVDRMKPFFETRLIGTETLHRL